MYILWSNNDILRITGPLWGIHRVSVGFLFDISSAVRRNNLLSSGKPLYSYDVIVNLIVKMIEANCDYLPKVLSVNTSFGIHRHPSYKTVFICGIFKPIVIRKMTDTILQTIFRVVLIKSIFSYLINMLQTIIIFGSIGHKASMILVKGQWYNTYA